jgi:3',5'-nucleoside bisphosphate phosphatase
MTFRADLHCHTTCSDGSFTPAELIALAKKQGLQGLSITDHDTIAAYETAIPLAKEAGIVLGTGVEFSADHNGHSVHILGYDFSLTNLDLLAFCEAHQKRRTHRNRAILDKLKIEGMSIQEEELKSFPAHAIGRPHIAFLMAQKKYVSSIQEAFQLYIGEGKPCYASGQPFTVQETIDIIHQAGGKAVIAHPHLSDDRKTLLALLSMNFDGIECYYARCAPHKERRWLKIAKHRNWLITGGSDFHGAFRPHIPLGCSWVDAPTFQKLFS